MPDGSQIPVLDHQLADDELAWIEGVRRDFATAASRAAEPKETLRSVLARPEHRLPEPMELTGNGPWRGRNAHGRLVAAVFLKSVELHTHPASRTDQFPVYVVGEAEAFAVTETGQPELTPVTAASHFHNAPGEPHAFLPRTDKPVNPDWEIAFIAITPRNLREDTYAVAPDVRALYERVTGREAPVR
jgi:hypothetical protein